ncbi:hypothetical protein K438DRAFT_1786932 [Mycena galopus ATCC 62051]|nr:hypothetical protein K438DRAFT_1786932 [Mycena galopus ATCC 62051]
MSAPGWTQDSHYVSQDREQEQSSFPGSHPYSSQPLPPSIYSSPPLSHAPPLHSTQRESSPHGAHSPAPYFEHSLSLGQPFGYSALPFDPPAPPLHSTQRGPPPHGAHSLAPYFERSLSLDQPFGYSYYPSFPTHSIPNTPQGIIPNYDPPRGVSTSSSWANELSTRVNQQPFYSAAQPDFGPALHLPQSGFNSSWNAPQTTSSPSNYYHAPRPNIQHNDPLSKETVYPLRHVAPPPVKQSHRPRRARSPPIGLSTYESLPSLRLPFVECSNPSTSTHGYSDLRSSPDPPLFMYCDPDLLVEAQTRFHEVINGMGVAKKDCPDETKTMWTQLWKTMQNCSYNNEDWVADIGTRALSLAAALVIHVLGFLNDSWDPSGFTSDICKPPRQYSQQGDKSACILYFQELLSALAAEWKTYPVLDAHKDNFKTQVLEGGHLLSGPGMIKKMGLQQSSISKNTELCRYGVIFTGQTMVITSQARTPLNDRELYGLKVSPCIDLCDESDQGVSAISLLFALLFPPRVFPFPEMPNPRSSSQVWSILEKQLLPLVVGKSGTQRPPRPGDGTDRSGRGPGGSNLGGGGSGFGGGGSGFGGGGSGFGSYNASSANYHGYNCQRMTMLHAGVPSVFNPPRKLVAIAPELLHVPAESTALIWDDSASDISGTLSTPTTPASADSCLLPLDGTSISTAPTTPPSGDTCLVPDDELPRLEISSVVQWGGSARVLRASLTVANSIPFPVVLKVFKPAQFHLVVKEVAAYHQLARLGVIVPRLISLMIPAHESGWVMMIIEDAGKPFGQGSQPWDGIPLTLAERAGIYLALVQIHAEGVLHGDPEPRNVPRMVCPQHALWRLPNGFQAPNSQKYWGRDCLIPE